MFKTKKKAASIKIPHNILKKEAEKMAKQIRLKEAQKEKKKYLQQKAKDSALKKQTQKKQQETDWEEHFDDSLQREFKGSVLVILGIILLVTFLYASKGTEQEVPFLVTNFFKKLFGIGILLVPLTLILSGVSMFSKQPMHFHPKIVATLVALLVSGLSLLNLFAPADYALQQAPSHGGAIGFAFGYFPRYYLGDLISWVLFGSLTFLSCMILFKLRVSTIIENFMAFFEAPTFDSGGDTVKVKNTPAPKTEKVKKEEKVTEKTDDRRFENDITIVNSTKAPEPSSKPKAKVVLDSNPEEVMSQAINQKFGEWKPPSLEILQDIESKVVVNEKELRKKAEAIREKLEQFGILVAMKSVHVGPTVTQFTLEPSAGVKLTKITSLKDDLALALAARSLRIEAPIRGQKLVGIEIPNEDRATVGMKEILESSVWTDDAAPLKLALGRDVAGMPLVANIAKMPHLLIAGKTGSGKSVAMNAFLVSLLWQNSPEKLRMILVDPKQVELKPYDHLPHLLTPVITQPEKAVSALAWAVAEMNSRYKKLSENGVRNLEELNEKVEEDEKEPYIVIVIDELADLMMVAGKDVEAAICRIAQMARAVGMHLIVATQRPSVDVVTGLIKANLPARIAFRVNTGIDSRTIIDSIGAEDLLGFGDMLYMDANSGQLTRVQGLYVTNEEVEKVTNYIKLQYPEMIANDEITKQSIEGMAKGGVLTAGMGEDAPADEDLDIKFEEAVSTVIETGKASASFLQRRLEIGYARAARILDQMEAKGIIGPARGAKAREIYGRQE